MEFAALVGCLLLLEGDSQCDNVGVKSEGKQSTEHGFNDVNNVLLADIGL